jgi:hypothetical protein
LENVPIKISAFLSKDGGYNRASVTYVDENGKEVRPDWKYSSDEIPKVEKKYYEEFGKEMTSSLKRDKFTEKLYLEVMSKLPNATNKVQQQIDETAENDEAGEVEIPKEAIPVKKNPAPKAQQKPAEEPEEEPNTDDDLPF